MADRRLSAPPLHRPRLSRRTFHRLAFGAGAFAGAAGAFPSIAGPAVTRAAETQPGPLRAVAAADRFGVNEAFRAVRFGSPSGAAWTRWTVQWSNLQPAPGPLNLFYFTDQGRNVLAEMVAAGMKVTAMVLSTPEWAAQTPGVKPGTSVPKGLAEPVFVGGKPNPANTWASFMYLLAEATRGLIDVFEIWNEVEIPAVGPNAVYNTWAGTVEDYYLLLKVASEAARAANPNARIVVAPYSYFRDQQAGQETGSLPWFDRFAELIKANGAGVFDVFALNLYRNPHDLWDRMWGGVTSAYFHADRTGFRRRLDEMGAAGKPIWLTEFNSMPYDDTVRGWSPTERSDGFRITMDEQASYIIQAYALGLCAGYERIFFHALQDDPYPVPDELWGLVRFNPDPQNGDVARARPAFAAYQVAAHYMGNADWCRLLVKPRPDPAGSRQYASRFKWAVQAAVFQRGDRRAWVLWNATDQPQTIGIAPWGADATLVDKDGAESPLARDDAGLVSVQLDPATRHFDLFGGDPPGYYYVGGTPLIVVEAGVPADAPAELAGFVAKEPRQDVLTDFDNTSA